MRSALLVLALVSAAAGQILDGIIQLPDSLGALAPYYHIAVDTASTPAVVYVGGEATWGGTGDILLIDPIDHTRLARIPTGPVADLCLNAGRRKLYASHASRNSDSVVVIDAVSRTIAGRIGVRRSPRGLVYNPELDRLYCLNNGDSSISVIDCAADTVMTTVTVGKRPDAHAFDTAGQRIYVACSTEIVTLDCATNEVSAHLELPLRVTALHFNDATQKLYATYVHGVHMGDTLAVIRAEGDSILKRMWFPEPFPYIVSYRDSAVSLVIVSRQVMTGQVSVVFFDANSDTIVGWVDWGRDWISGLAVDSQRGKLYCVGGVELFAASDLMVLDVRTRQRIASTLVDGEACGASLLPDLDLLYCTPGFAVNPQMGATLSVLDCGTDSVLGVIPVRVGGFSLRINEYGRKLYYSIPAMRGLVGVVDCERNATKSFLHLDYVGGYGPSDMAYVPAGNKLYVSENFSHLLVYDGESDSLCSVIECGGSLQELWWQSSANKLYCSSSTPDGHDLVVVDCGLDSVVAVLHPNTYIFDLVTVPEFNRVYCFLQNRHLWVIDCGSDSVVLDTAGLVLVGYWTAYAFVPEQARLYCASPRRMDVIDLVNHRRVDSITRPGDTPDAARLLYSPSTSKLYWSNSGWDGEDSIYVVDTRTNAVAAKLTAGKTISDIHLDRTGRYIYGLSYDDSMLFTIDTQTDSVVSRSPRRGRSGGIVLDSARHRFYASSTGEWAGAAAIPVFRDSVVPGGVVEASSRQGRRMMASTIARGVLFFPGTSGVLLDISGRKVADLKLGANDVRRLAPGVYFIRSLDECDSRKLLIAD